MQGEHSPRGSLSPRGSYSRPGSALVGPLAERQMGELDRALLPRRSSGPDISILSPDVGLGLLIDTSDIRWGASYCLSLSFQMGLPYSTQVCQLGQHWG